MYCFNTGDVPLRDVSLSPSVSLSFPDLLGVFSLDYGLTSYTLIQITHPLWSLPRWMIYIVIMILGLFSFPHEGGEEKFNLSESRDE